MLYSTCFARCSQVLQMGADGKNETSMSYYWWIPMPTNIVLEFMPSISVEHKNKWKNMTWTEDSQYIFNDLTPYTSYNMTVYVRNKNTSVIFPPAKFLVQNTREGEHCVKYNS